MSTATVADALELLFDSIPIGVPCVLHLAMRLIDIAGIVGDLPRPRGRKYCLNFAFSSDFEIDAKKLRRLFNPNDVMVKITPIHNNNACRENGIETVDGYSSFAPYAKAEEELKAEGFDVLVFVPSMDEEDGLVTCGNAVLGGSELNLPKTSIINIEGIKRE